MSFDDFEGYGWYAGRPFLKLKVKDWNRANFSADFIRMGGTWFELKKNTIPKPHLEQKELQLVWEKFISIYES